MEKIIIFVNEFFGAWGTARGGYGFLARNLLPKGLGVSPKEMTICLGRSKSLFFPEVKYTEEGFKLIKLPKLRILAAKIVNQYDIVISIEATVDFLFSLKGRLRRKILFWIQDPRPKADWEEINTVQLAKEGCYWNEKTYSLVGECYRLGLIKFASQAKFLRPKAVELYGLPKIAENEMMLLPNPIVEGGGDIENLNKENEIIFVGRLDSVKRGWLFCEIAKNMPQYKFLIMGASTNADEKARNSVLGGLL